jgi:hypothetical protein
MRWVCLTQASYIFSSPVLTYTPSFLQGLHRAHDDFANHWAEPLPAAVSLEELEERNKAITLDEVQEWVEKRGGIVGRLSWWEAYSPHSQLYQRVGKPLLSIRTAGSMDVERKVKPIKHKILSKERNALSDGKAIVLFRARENLKHLMKVKTDFKSLRTTTSLSHCFVKSLLCCEVLVFIVL